MFGDNSLGAGAGINKKYLKPVLTVYMASNLYERSEAEYMDGSDHENEHQHE